MSLKKNKSDMNDLCVLDLGAGNGMVGHELCSIGVDNVYGIDIEKNAKIAVERDRPRAYKKYYVEDLMCLSAPVKKRTGEKII